MFSIVLSLLQAMAISIAQVALTDAVDEYETSMKKVFLSAISSLLNKNKCQATNFADMDVNSLSEERLVSGIFL